MNEKTAGGRAIAIASVGHAAFAATMIALGILGLIQRDFAPVWQPVPEGAPARAVLIFLCALIPLVCGIGLFWQRAAAAAARVLFAWLLLWLLLLRAPRMFLSFNVNTWWASCQTAVMVAAALVLSGWFAADRGTQRPGFLPRHLLARRGQAVAPLPLDSRSAQEYRPAMSRFIHRLAPNPLGA